MKKATLFLVLVVVLMTSVPVLADGKFYWSEEIPPEIPYQRALLLFDGQQETLILQSKYDSGSSATANSFGWVVPVPSVPELASMDANLADSWFAYVDYASSPEVTQIFPMLLLAFLILGLVGAVLAILLWVLSLFVPRLQHLRRNCAFLFAAALLSLAGLALMAGYMLLMGASPESTTAERVEIIKAEQVGIYDVQVVKADQAQDLITWLNQNRLQFDEEDTQVFDQYLQRGWCFVVARIDPSSGTDEQKVVSEGLAAPLIMRFQAEAPVYPLALTSTAGHKTEILLYVLSESKWKTDGRLDLHYAGGTGASQYLERQINEGIQPAGFFSAAHVDHPYLCKFKGTLTPEQMREDLTLSLAENDEPFRKHIFIW